MTLACELLFAGCTDFVNSGRTGKGASDDASYPDLDTPSAFAGLEHITWKALGGGCSATHCAAIDVDGNVYTWGRNERGQLGHGDYIARGTPTKVGGALKGLKCVSVSCGKNHTAVVTEDGDVYGFGSHKSGQCGDGKMKKVMKKGDAEDDKLLPVKALVANGVSVHCGQDFTCVVTKDGEVFTYGSPQYGQLGHGTDHEYNSSASSIKIVYEPQPHPKKIAAHGFGERKIVKLAAGANHVVCFDSAGKLWTWGCGGYGRLGHKVATDEHAPKMVEIQGGDRNLIPADAVVGAGSMSSFVSALQGQLYAWGKLKTSGDTQMYPSPFMGLQGWTLRDFACGYVTFAGCSEKSAVTWGGASYGELGYGPKGKKSSAQPDLVPSLEGLATQAVAAGNGYTLFLVNKEDAKSLPRFKPGPDVNQDPSLKPKGGNVKNFEKGPAKKKQKK
jgi:alpha-tubulin suppressor-like RCC1 family protein